MQEEQKKRKRRVSLPSKLEVENRKIGRILYFFNGLKCRLSNPDWDISSMLTASERIKLKAAHILIQEAQLSVTERQVELVRKLKEERYAAKSSNNN